MKKLLVILLIFSSLKIFSQDIKYRFDYSIIKYKNERILPYLNVENNFSFSFISNLSAAYSNKFSFYDNNNKIIMNRNFKMYTFKEILIPAYELKIQYNFYKKNDKFSMWTKTYSTKKNNDLN